MFVEDLHLKLIGERVEDNFPGENITKMFLSLVFPQLSKSALPYSLSSKLTEIQGLQYAFFLYFEIFAFIFKICV